MKNKLTIILTVSLGIIVAAVFLFLNLKKETLTTPQSSEAETEEPIVPSQTNLEYSDPSGFNFTYPDNLSLVSKETNDRTYADIELSAKNIEGLLRLKITDTNFKSLEEWLEANNVLDNSKEVKLGTLKAYEVKQGGKMLLGSIDQGILFTIELPIDKDRFWSKVYEMILPNFLFTQATHASSTSTSSNYSTDVIFEGEEVIE